MSLRALLEEAARELEPDQQGQLDGLCGIYATINGIRIALYPAVKLKHAQRRRLFVAGVEAVARTRAVGRVVHDGMSATMLRKVSEAIAAEATEMIGFDIALLPAIPRGTPTRRPALLREMRRQLKLGHPLLITLWGAYDHTTVVVGFSKARLKLFDSYGMRWVAIRSIAVADDEEGRHRVTAGQIMAVVSFL